jgi:hypothetical protein
MKKNNKLLILFIFTFLIIISGAVSGVYLIRNFQGMKITVTFPDAKGLYEKSPVEYNGIHIGSVQKIQAETQPNVSVVLKIDSDQTEHLRQNALFVISQNVSMGTPPGILVGYCKNQNPHRFPKLASGVIVNGENNEILFMIKTRVGCFKETSKSLSPALETLKQNLDGILNSPEVHQFYQDLEKFFIDLNKIIEDNINHFIEEKGPEIRKKIEDLIKELERMGRQKEAEELKKVLTNEFQHEI